MPAIQVLGAPRNDPPSNSSGYSPRFQTLPSRSCAKKASSASASSPSLTSTSHTTRVCTPSITLVRSVTVNVTVCGSGPPPRLARPSRVSCVPGVQRQPLVVDHCPPRELPGLELQRARTGWRRAGGLRERDGIRALPGSDRRDDSQYDNQPNTGGYVAKPDQRLATHGGLLSCFSLCTTRSAGATRMGHLTQGRSAHCGNPHFVFNCLQAAGRVKDFAPPHRSAGGEPPIAPTKERPLCLARHGQGCSPYWPHSWPRQRLLRSSRSPRRTSRIRTCLDVLAA